MNTLKSHITVLSLSILFLVGCTTGGVDTNTTKAVDKNINKSTSSKNTESRRAREFFRRCQTWKHRTREKLYQYRKSRCQHYKY